MPNLVVHAEMIEELVLYCVQMVIDCILIILAKCMEVKVRVAYLLVLLQEVISRDVKHLFKMLGQHQLVPLFLLFHQVYAVDLLLKCVSAIVVEYRFEMQIECGSCCIRIPRYIYI